MLLELERLKKENDQLRNERDTYKKQLQLQGEGNTLSDMDRFGFRFIFDRALDGTILFDSRNDFTYLYVNKALCDLFDMTEEEILKTNLTTFIAPSWQNQCKASLKTLLTDGEVRTEMLMQLPNGKERLIDLVVQLNVFQHVGLAIVRDVTEQRRIQKKLADKEKLFRSLLEQAHDGIVITKLSDPFTIIEANKSAEHILEATKEQLMQTDFLSFFDQDYIPYVESQVTSLIERGVVTGELVCQTLNGKKVPVEFTGTTIEVGKEVHVLLIGRDISERKAKEKALMQNRQMDQSLFAFNPHLVCRLNLSGQMVSVNETMTTILRYSLDELTHQFFHLVVHQDDQVAWHQFFNNAYAKNQTEVRLQTKNKEILHFELVSSPILIDGELEGFYLIGKDITTQKKQQQELRASHKLVNTIINNIPVGVKVSNIHHDVLLINKQMKDVFSSTTDSEELFTLSLEEKMNLGRKLFVDYEMFESRISKVIAEKKQVLNMEYALLNGKTVEQDYTPFMMDGEQIGHIFIYRDITKRKKMEESLRTAKNEAEKANHAKMNFLLMMSHELRTPLNSILGFSQILEGNRREPLLPSQREKVQKILRSGRHLLTLINDILDFSRVESGHLQLQMEQVNVGDVLKEALKLIQPFALDCEVNVCFDENVLEQEIMIMADSTRLKQVFLNLLSNGIKYNRKKGILMVSFHGRNGQVEVVFQDTGVGIKREYIEDIFVPFTRFEDAGRKREGTGIGLALVKRMTEAMGGHVHVESTYGKGSTFTLSYNKIKPFTYREPIKLQSHSQASIKQLNHQTILYIEDKECNIELMNHVLKQMPTISLLNAKTVKEGIRVIFETPPHLILLDLDLPDGSGFEIVKMLKRNEEFRHIPIIAVSADAMATTIQKAKELGCAEYIKKPFDVEYLVEVCTCYLSVNTEV
ncbi:PAS domain-containing hybrid sensor histidine kinase/response regulator [Bacillus sp. CGMCC 1.16541]|uniref:PAS domain-containing hybrid sensor histidine kinase/response regulator n=1 Tax=Bacillus sp. CGMCC 1.16541 TaxID=2185143 RepID=UPI000D73F2BA|nr:PAS domain-containing hybrid sensor histidine kinase/response regulator [Bacillus sp. CGMCC 1.16541]